MTPQVSPFSARKDLPFNKAKGALKFLEEKISKEIIKGSMGIGHTRWATHGEPSDVNSHPHTNVSGKIAVVHNGIIENYAKLKAWLEGNGIVFRSQTDTEVIAHLIDFNYKGNLLEAVIATLKKIEGSYALGVICEDNPDQIIAVRKDSPLVIGSGQGENLIASDVPAILEYTREVYYLNDHEIAVLYRDRVDFFDTEGTPVAKKTVHVRLGRSRGGKRRIRAFHAEGNSRAAEGAHGHSSRAHQDIFDKDDQP